MNITRKIRSRGDRLMVYYYHNLISTKFSSFKPGDVVEVIKEGDSITVRSGAVKERHWRGFK